MRAFGDGFETAKRLGGRRLWRIPVMDGEFVCEHDTGVGRGRGRGRQPDLPRPRRGRDAARRRGRGGGGARRAGRDPAFPGRRRALRLQGRLALEAADGLDQRRLLPDAEGPARLGAAPRGRGGAGDRHRRALGRGRPGLHAGGAARRGGDRRRITGSWRSRPAITAASSAATISTCAISCRERPRLPPARAPAGAAGPGAARAGRASPACPRGRSSACPSARRASGSWSATCSPCRATIRPTSASRAARTGSTMSAPACREAASPSPAMSASGSASR